MNDEAARQGRPDTSSITSPDDSSVGGRLKLLACTLAPEFERIAEFAPDASTRRRLYELAASAESRRVPEELCNGVAQWRNLDLRRAA